MSPHSINNKKFTNNSDEDKKQHGINYCNITKAQLYFIIHDGLQLIFTNYNNNFIKQYMKNLDDINTIIYFQNSKTLEYFFMPIIIYFINPFIITIIVKSLFKVDKNKFYNLIKHTTNIKIKNNKYKNKFDEYIPIFNKILTCETYKNFKILQIYLKK